MSSNLEEAVARLDRLARSVGPDDGIVISPRDAQQTASDLRTLLALVEGKGEQ